MKVYWSNDVVDYAHPARHSRMSWYSGINDGEATKRSQEPLSLPLEVFVDYKRPCHVHFALPRCCSQDSFRTTDHKTCRQVHVTDLCPVLVHQQSRPTVMHHLLQAAAVAAQEFLVLLVDQKTNRASALLWQSRRQTLTALSAPEAEVVALSEALMPAIIIHESCRNIGLEVGPSPDVPLRCQD